MKRIVFISVLAMLIPMIGMSQNQSTFIDDVYFKPSDAKLAPAKTNVKQKPATKNGAREIVFIELKRPDSLVIDSVTLLGQANDSIDSEGNYINEFNGSQSDLEYAERIRRFHDPKYTVFISDPAYNDIYFLNSSDWNVYVDGPYAYVTPTWTNPNYWNYRYNTWGYGNWGFGYGYGWNSPWGCNGYYGYGCGFGCGYGCGWVYGYNCFDNYYGCGNGYDNGYWGGGSWGGISYYKPDSRHNEGTRRQYGDTGRGTASSRLASTSGTATGSRSSVISAGYSGRSSGSSYTVVRDGNSTRGGIQSDVYSRGNSRSVSVNNSARSYQYNDRDGVARNTGARTSTYDYRSGSNASSGRTNYANTTTRTSSGAAIDTRPRTSSSYNNSSNGYAASSRGTISTSSSTMSSRTGYSSSQGSYTSGGRGTTYSVGASPRSNYSSNSTSNGTYSSPRSSYSSSNSTPNYNSSSSSNESYRSSTPSTSSSSSSGSYSSGSSSSGGGSRSGGGSSDSGGSRSGGSSSGGRR